MNTERRMRILKKLNPSAFAEGTLLYDLEQDLARIKADPEIQRIRRKVNREANRKQRIVQIPVYFACGAIWFALNHYLPELVTPIIGFIGFIVVTMFLWTITKQREFS